MASTESEQFDNFPKTVVLGASGRLGRLIRPFWKDAPVTWVSRTPTEGCIALDFMNDSTALVGLLSGAESIICLAGVTPAPDAKFSDNLCIARACLDAARTAQAGPVLLTSSAAVYGAQAGILSEDSAVAPPSPYGQSKLAMEQMAQAHPHPSTCLRIGNVAGADAALGGWQEGAQMDQLPDGRTPARSYIGPATLARVLGQLIQTPDLPEVLNLATPGSVEMGALLEAANLPFAYCPSTPATLANVTLDTARLETLVSFQTNDSTAAQMVREWKEATA